MSTSPLYPLSFRSKLIITILIISAAFYIFNLFTYKYEASSYIHYNQLLILAPGFLIYYFSRNIRDSHPQLAFFFESLWMILVAAFMLNLFCIAIQYTPFNLQDATLQRWDSLLGFNSIAVINWFHQFPKLIFVLKLAYHSAVIQLFFMPIILAMLQQQRRFDVFINACFISAIIGYTIYYFFPTSDPAALFTCPYFTKAMHEIPIRFYDVQHHIPNNNLQGGLIDFPSFHVIWAVFIIYSFKNYKFLLFPLLIWNSLVIISTMALGWHFLTDAIAGVIIALFSLALAEKKSTKKDYTFKEMLQGYRRELRH